MIGAVFSLQGIKDKIKQERVALQEKELLYRVLDISQEAALITDKDGQIVYANAEAEKTMKVSPKDIIKRSYNDPKWDIRYANNKRIKEKDLPFKKIC
ncbi:MAG: PAS domain-containing protein [Bacteroidales bacterium]|nr:PAS domain-containing protein [Bacteroidales bacterium]MCF8351440.1 PAS domain-containing protein [Bacteroidales bacterium]MCF8374783.1 PAS domain-containing protein [Bacteroidales bacterium]MCF8399813.1 PAS domain-containing protein [Bacteroidales bacterium]